MVLSDSTWGVGVDLLRRSLEAETCRRTLAELVSRARPVVEPRTPQIWGQHIDAICTHLEAVTEGTIKKLIINIAPGHCKSLLVSVFWPAWEWIDRPHLRTLSGSHDPRLSARDAVRTRDLITSAWFKDTFRPSWKLKGDQNTKSFYQNSLNGLRWTFGMGGQVTGWRGDKVVVDDPLDAKGQFNQAVKDNGEFVWDNKLSSRVNNPQEARFVLVMQRLADDDLAGRLLKRTVPLVDRDGKPLRGDDGRPQVDEKGKPLRVPEYQHLCLPTEFEPDRKTRTSIGWTDWREEPGELLFPAYFSPQVVETTKQTLGWDGWAGQHQQSPIASGGNKFKLDWFTGRLWDWDDRLPNCIRLRRDGEPAEPILLDTCTIFASVDVAAGEKRTNDFSVYFVWALTPTGLMVLLAEVRDRMSEPDSIEQAKALKRAWPRLGLFVVEQNGVGLPLTQQMRAAQLPVVAISVNRDKVARAATAIVYAQTGRVFIPDPDAHPWATTWLSEITMFPNGRFDRVDCFSLAAEQVFTGAVAKPSEATPVATVGAGLYSHRADHSILGRPGGSAGRR